MKKSKTTKGRTKSTPTKVVKAWAVIGTDGSYIDALHWWPEELRKKWAGTEGIKIVQVEIRPIPQKAKRKK